MKTKVEKSLFWYLKEGTELDLECIPLLRPWEDAVREYAEKSE